MAHDELRPVLEQPRDVSGVAGVGEPVQHGNVHLRALARHPAHKVTADEPAVARDDDVAWGGQDTPYIYMKNCAREVTTLGGVTPSMNAMMLSATAIPIR